MKLKCAIIAGEASADVIGKEIISISQNHIEWFGVGGPLMQSEEFNSEYDWKKIQAFGIFDVIIRIPQLLKSLLNISNIIISKKPRLIVTIDTKGFNFLLIRFIKYRTLKSDWKPKIIHVVAPTVWAWRANRSKKIRKLVDKLICLFPKEPQYFDNNGFKAKFCGHPAVDRLQKIKIDKKKFLNQLNIHENRDICALLPGSRPNEIKRILPTLIKFASEIEKSFINPPLFIIPIASDQENIIKNILSSNQSILTLDNSILGDSLMINCDYALVTSGTATLEYAISGIPVIAFYKTGFLSAFLGRRIIDMSKIILPNWILGENTIQFLFQEEFDIERLMNEFKKIYNKNNSLFTNSSKKLKKLLKLNNKSFKQNIFEEIKEILK